MSLKDFRPAPHPATPHYKVSVHAFMLLYLFLPSSSGIFRIPVARRADRQRAPTEHNGGRKALSSGLPGATRGLSASGGARAAGGRLGGCLRVCDTGAPAQRAQRSFMLGARRGGVSLPPCLLAAHCMWETLRLRRRAARPRRAAWAEGRPKARGSCLPAGGRRNPRCARQLAQALLPPHPLTAAGARDRAPACSRRSSAHRGGGAWEEAC